MFGSSPNSALELESSDRFQQRERLFIRPNLWHEFAYSLSVRSTFVTVFLKPFTFSQHLYDLRVEKLRLRSRTCTCMYVVTYRSVCKGL